jgi:acyl carrier protein
MAAAIQETLRTFVLSTYLADEPPEDIANGMALRSSGILDSFATMGIVHFIDRQFGVKLDVYDLSVDRFDSIDDMAAVVLRKQSTHTTV